MIFACPHTSSVSPMPSLNNSKLQTSGRLSSGAHNANRFHTINNIGLKTLIQQNVFGWFLRFHTLDIDGWVCLIKKHLGRINAAPSFSITVTTSENLHWSLQIFGLCRKATKLKYNWPGSLCFQSLPSFPSCPSSFLQHLRFQHCFNAQI